MFKKVLSILLVSSLMMTTAVISAGATEREENEETAIVKTIKPVIKNNITTYYDQDGNEVDITADNREIKVDESKLPTTYDLRDEGRSTSVKDQGQEGLCWDFASTASMESSILSNPELRAELGENADQTLDLSEAGNAWYIHTSIEDESSYLYGDCYPDENKGSDGGSETRIAMGLSSGFGAYPEELMPYSDWGDYFPEQLRFYSDYRLKELAILDNDVNLIKQRLMDNGAVSVLFSCYQANFNTVDKIEVYYDDGGPIKDTPHDMGHVVSLIGWDDNFSRENFNEKMRPENDGAWLCKNSWGTDRGCQVEGYEGYFWMSYETANMSFSQFVMQSVDAFDNIYQHQFSWDYSTEVASAANVFTAEKDEVLEQICFSNVGAEDMTFEVYKLEEGYTSPTDGELLISFENSVDYTGTHCIDIPKQLELSAGDTFSVVLKSDDNFQIYHRLKEVNTLENKSFIILTDDEWTDVTQSTYIGYINIKAYTSNKGGAVYKDELSQLIDKADNMVIRDDVPQEDRENFSSELANAKKVLNDNTVSQNTVDNTYCLLDNAKDKITLNDCEINTIDDFIKFISDSQYGKYDDGYVTLNSDLDFSNYREMKPLFANNCFSGVFNGNGHTISNLKINSDGEGGLFENIQNAEISNLKLDNCNFTAKKSVGAIAGRAEGSSIINCTITNTEITNIRRFAGGVLGIAENSSVTGCTVVNSKIVGKEEFAGGIVGMPDNVTVKACSVLKTEIIGKSQASDFACLENIENCVEDDTVVKSLSQIICDGTIVYNRTESSKCSSFLVYKDGKYTLEPFVGTITDVSSEEAILTNSGDKFEIDLNGNTVAYLNVSYEEFDAGYFFFDADIATEEIALTGYSNYEDESATEIIFSSNIGGLPVTSIDKSFYIDSIAPIKSMTFSGTIQNLIDLDLTPFSETLQTVTFGEGTKIIGWGMLENFESITTVNLPNSLEHIGDCAFNHCSKLETINFGENLKEIGYAAFEGCNNLKSIVLPDSVEKIGREAFLECESLSVVLGKNIKEIGERAFGYTYKLAKNRKFVKIPDFTVIGYAGTPAETYASENGYKFIDASTQDYEIPQGYFDYGVFIDGDVNLDGVVTVADATLIQKYLVNETEFDQIQECNALVDYNSYDISINNATYIQKMIAGLE